MPTDPHPSEKLVRSRQRVSDHGEVFTPAWLVDDMLDLVRDETERIDSRFLEPACGSGNFLVPILERKLAALTAILETADRLTEEREPSVQQYRLLAGALRTLAQGDHAAELVLDAYLLRALAIAGWAPSFHDCAQCGDEGPHRAFHVAHGGVLCRSCRVPGSSAPAPETLELLAALLVARLLQHLGLDAFALQRAEVLDEHLAVEVVDLVLDAGGVKPVGFFFVHLAVEIHEAHAHPRRPLDLLIANAGIAGGTPLGSADMRNSHSETSSFSASARGASGAMSGSITSRAGSVEFRSAMMVSPPMVVWCSCIASSMALWVFGVARLISSASTRLAKIGPSFDENSAVFWL